MLTKKNSSKTTKHSKAKTAKRVNETNAQKTARLGPTREIVRFVNVHKGREGNETRVAVMSCKHVRSVDRTKRKTLRCAKCRDRKPVDVTSVKITRFEKKAKKAA